MSEPREPEAPNITAKAARRAEPVIRPADTLALEEMRNNREGKKLEIQRGWVGKALGTGSEKSGNVATLTTVASFLLILVLFLRIDLNTQFDQFFKVLTSMLGVVGLALGYLFRSRDNR